MIKLDLALLAVAACLFVSLALPCEASAQPAAMKQMQDAQRKAEQKARDAKKKDDQQAEAQKSDSAAKPASAP